MKSETPRWNWTERQEMRNDNGQTEKEYNKGTSWNKRALIKKWNTGEEVKRQGKDNGRKWKAKDDTWGENFKIKQEITKPPTQTMSI